MGCARAVIVRLPIDRPPAITARAEATMAERTKTIDGSTYTLAPLAAKVARECSFRAGKALAGGVASGDNPAAMIAIVISRLSIEDIEWIAAQHERRCSVSTGQASPMLDTISDAWWTERSAAWVEWFAWCLEVTCTGFFSGLTRVLAARVDGAKAKASPSQPASTG